MSETQTFPYATHLDIKFQPLSLVDVPALVKALDEALTQEWNADELSSRHSRSWGDVARELYPILASTLRR